MNIEEIASEIKNTENILKNYSNTLKSQELASLDKDQSNMSENIPNADFRTFMKILEEKAEYLYELKKRYNFLYKKLNNLN